MPFSLLKGYFLQEREFAAKKNFNWRTTFVLEAFWQNLTRDAEAAEPRNKCQIVSVREEKILTSNLLHKYDWADLEPAVFPASSEIFFWASNEIAEWT